MESQEDIEIFIWNTFDRSFNHLMLHAYVSVINYLPFLALFPIKFLSIQETKLWINLHLGWQLSIETMHYKVHISMLPSWNA